MQAPSDFQDALAKCNAEVPVGPHGSIQLIDVMPRLIEVGGLGPEAAIVQAARVSTGGGMKTLPADLALLRYLFRHKHLTPFEMVTLKWRVVAPLFTTRQWMRHRAGSFNEQSARYGVVPVTDPYLPTDMLAQSAANKQGGAAPLPAEAAAAVTESFRGVYAHAEAAYGDALAGGVARELARIVLPEGRYTTFYWSVNLRNLFGFLELRAAPDAQGDIRAYAGAILGILESYCPLAVQAFRDYQLEAVTLSALEVRALQSGGDAEMTARERASWAEKQKKLSAGALKSQV